MHHCWIRWLIFAGSRILFPFPTLPWEAYGRIREFGNPWNFWTSVADRSFRCHAAGYHWIVLSFSFVSTVFFFLCLLSYCHSSRVNIRTFWQVCRCWVRQKKYWTQLWWWMRWQIMFPVSTWKSSRCYRLYLTFCLLKNFSLSKCTVMEENLSLGFGQL